MFPRKGYDISYSFIVLEGRSRITVSIDWGAAPQLKSDEFLDLPLLLNELGSVLSVKPPKKMMHILGARLT